MNPSVPGEALHALQHRAQARAADLADDFVHRQTTKKNMRLLVFISIIWCSIWCLSYFELMIVIWSTWFIAIIMTKNDCFYILLWLFGWFIWLLNSWCIGLLFHRFSDLQYLAIMLPNVITDFFFSWPDYSYSSKHFHAKKRHKGELRARKLHHSTLNHMLFFKERIFQRNSGEYFPN